MSSERRHPILVRMADWLLVWRNWLFFAAIVITVLAVGPSNSLKLDEAIESFYAPVTRTSSTGPKASGRSAATSS
ncbi:MAG: hypothetical protein U0992_09405 [Planctomycetaceae bacterium]